VVLPLRDADGAHTRADDVAAWPVEERVQVQLVRCVPRGLCGGRAPPAAERALFWRTGAVCWRLLTC